MAALNLKLAATGAALVLAFGAGWAVQGWRMSAEYAALEMRYATRLAQAHENALTEYTRLEKVKNDALRQAEIEAEKNAAAAAAAARRAADSLREQLHTVQQRLADATHGACIDYATAAGDVLAECAAEVTDLAAKADGHANDAATCKAAWPVMPVKASVAP